MNKVIEFLKRCDILKTMIFLQYNYHCYSFHEITDNGPSFKLG